MKLDDWMAAATAKLEKAGIGSARLDSLILLEDLLGKDRGYILAHPELELSATRLKRLNAKLKRRANHLPMAYIRGFSEFYGRKFLINRHVLEPRPESEPMISLLKKLALPPKPTIADVGTGSGCLGITAALEISGSTVDLYDIDTSAIAVAKHNCALHEVNLHAYKRDLLKRPVRHYNVLLANLPYVPNHFRINQAAAMEPKIAIFGGSDGLDIYRRLFNQLSHFTWRPSFVITESLPPQHQELSLIAQKNGFELHKSEGFVQVYQSQS